MKIAFLVPRLDKPSTKFRVQSLLPLFSDSGFETKVFPLSRTTITRWKVFYHLNQYDLVLIQKKLFSLWELVFIRRRSRKLVYDFDDAVMFKKGEKMDLTNPVRQKRFEQTVRLSDWVIAGNEYLKDEVGMFSDRVSVVPTPVDTDKYIPGEKRSGEKRVRIGWMGNRSTVHYVKPLGPVFSDLKSRFPNVEITLISDTFPGIEGLEKTKAWKETEELQDLQSFDIGIMPLPDDCWTRGKCGFKLLQYQAVGLPVVSSPVGVNRGIVTEGINGFFADTPQEWIDKLSQLITTPELRSRLGIAGREKVVQEYSLKAIGPYYGETLKMVVNSSD